MKLMLKEPGIDNSRMIEEEKQKNVPISSHLSILVVDDNQETTTMLSKYFKAKGFRPTVTNDPMEGLQFIRKEKFDVILLDVMMPVISGIGIIEILAGEDSLKDQNIFIFSGANLPQIQLTNLLRRDGINGFLKKPIELSEIYKILS
ncbi:MAG: response regulator [Nitrosopumilaceae archaeon]|nr:response regulator [Nitrosopumilaceae archaeon]